MLDVIGASGGSFSGVGLGLVIVAAGGALGILSCCAALSLKRSVQSPTEAAADETQPLAEPA